MFQSKSSQVFRSIFPCRLTAQHKKRKQSSNDKNSFFVSLNEEENDVYWSEEPLKDHPDAEDKPHVSIAGSFPYALGFGDLGRNKRRKKNANANAATAEVAGTPATVISVATPSEESTSWAGEFHRRFPAINNETGWVETVGQSSNAFSAQKMQPPSKLAQDVIGAMHQQHATASDSEEDIFDANSVKVEPKRRLFGSGGEGSPFATPTTFPVQTISPSQRDTLPKTSTRKTREQQRQRRTERRNRRRQRHKELVDVVTKISKKCGELQINLAEKDADIEQLRWNHESLLRDLEQTGKSPSSTANSHRRSGSSDRGTGMTSAHDYSNVGNDEERKVLQSTLTANAKLETALKAMESVAFGAQKTLHRTQKDHQVEFRKLRRTHEVALNEQRGTHNKRLRGMQEQLATVNQQVQHLKDRNYDLEIQLDCAKTALQEETAQRAQENLNHVYKVMDLARDHENRVAELKKDKAMLSEQVEEGFLKMDEMRMSLELVKADAEYASAKLERTQRAHRDEIRSLTKETDDQFFQIMAARERECLDMNQELNSMFGGECGSMQNARTQSSSKFD